MLDRRLRWFGIAVLSVMLLIAACGSCSTAPEAPEFGVPSDELPVCGVITSDPVIGLSFDGGPGPFTAADLRLLQRYDIHATFFVTGKHGAERPSLVREERSLGMD